LAVTTVGFYWNGELQSEPLSAVAMDRWRGRCFDAGGKYCVFELSSEALARGFLERYPVELGVFTNLSHDHLDAHQSPEHYLASKAQLFINLPATGSAVLNAADPNSALLREVLPDGVRVLEYGVPSRGGVADTAALRAERVVVSRMGTRLTLAPHRILGEVTELEVPAIGEIFAENALAALGGALAMGISPEQAARALASAPVPPGRFEIVSHSPFVVLDYAHTPDALERTLATARVLAREQRGRVLVVFGAGGERDRAKRLGMGHAARDADWVCLTNDNPRSEEPSAIVQAIAAGLVGHPALHVTLDRRAAIELALCQCAEGDVLVIAGKGHEIEQHVAGRVEKLSDRDVVADLLAGRGSPNVSTSTAR
jgi:UDP-N-acetylmuramoyl-L-alanyl-D-glutamate--2,6-diaminopimelate ligase